VRAFGAGCEFGGVLGVVLVALDASLAISNPWISSIESKRTNKLSSIAVTRLMRAGHRIEIVASPLDPG
jgi:hypothetical protein